MEEPRTKNLGLRIFLFVSILVLGSWFLHLILKRNTIFRTLLKLRMNKPLPSFLQTTETITPEASNAKVQGHSFIDKTLTRVIRFINTGFIQLDIASKKGFLQSVDARVKVCFLLIYLVLISIIRNNTAQLCVFALIGILFLLSRISISRIYGRIFILSFLFGFVVVAPAMLNLFSKGEIVFSIINFEKTHKWLIYNIPQEIGITREGLLFTAKFWIRILNSLSLSFLIFYTTPFNEIIRALKIFRIPNILLMTIMLTWKFIFVLSQTFEESYLVLKMRWWNRTPNIKAREIIAGRISHIFRRAWSKYDEVYKAMIARGYTGEVQIFSNRTLKLRDWGFVGGLLVAGYWLLVTGY